jgi:hypothetical protein
MCPLTIGDAALLKKKHHHYGNYSKRGRPTDEFIETHGPILKKKATFYVDETLCRKVRRCARAVGLSVSDLVELSLKKAISHQERRVLTQHQLHWR